MASYSPKLLEKKYNNWVKAQLAVLFTKDGIQPFVCNDLQRFQLKSLSDICYNNGLCSGTLCSSCCTENVVKCPTDKICNVRRGRCSFHRNFVPAGCPNSICNHFQAAIQNVHRYKGPSYKNTDATLWCSKSWEVAKCFMPPDGYKDVACASETDFNGIISVIINYTDFQSRVQENLTARNNIFEQARVIGRNVRHSSSLEVEDHDLHQYFRVLQTLLSDPKYLATDTHAQNAKQKLIDLENDTLVIGKDDIRKALDDVAKVTQDKIRTEIDEQNKQYEMIKMEMITRKREDLQSLELKAAEGIKQIEDASVKVIGTLKNEGRAERETIDELGNKKVEQIEDTSVKVIGTLKNEGRAERETIVELGNKKREEMEEAAETQMKRIKERSDRDKEEKYIEAREKLKKQLVKFYKNKRSTVPLSPLVEEKDTALAGFYVMPDMVMVKQKSHTSHEEKRTPINSLTDLFFTGSENPQNIYLSADAGFGKTSFSKYLAITWVQTCCHDSNRKCFKEEELKALGQFDFLFLVLLRDSTNVCTIEKMIEQQIINRPNQSASQCPLQDVLEREKCLIILDGLDEWNHPDNGCTEQKEKVPHRYACGDNCVILTTTRPWKLGVSNLKTSEIDKKVELVQLSEDSTRQLEKNAIRKMSGVTDDGELREKTQEFDEVIEDRGLQHMQTIPLLLMYITCLWCNKIPIGNSKVEVYINIIEFLLLRTAQKHPEVHPSSDPSHTDIPESRTAQTHPEVLPSSEPSHSDIPEYFMKHKFCEKFYSLLTALAELAYHTLFNEERENTLVFDGSVAENYLKADDMKLSLLSGILTGSTTTTLIERKSKISFSHKTVQELFAAIFISSQSDAQKTVVEKCKNVQSILDMSTICEFVSKMNSKMMCEISAGLMSVINEDEETRKYRTRTDHVFMYMKPLYNIQKMLVSCLQEMTGSENIKLCLQDFFINKDTIHDKHLQRLFKLNTTNMKSLYYEGVRDEDLSLFLSPSLQTLRVWGVTWRNYEGNLCEKLYSLKNVQYLYIGDLGLSHEMLKIFYNFICGTKTIKQLTWFRLYCIEHDEDCKMMLNLSKHSQLKYVHLSCINHLDESSLLLSRDMLNIERVELRYIEISGEWLQNMVKNMETISHFVTVEMYDIKPETEYERIRNYIRSSQTFDVTRDEEDVFGRKWFEFQTRKPSKE